MDGQAIVFDPVVLVHEVFDALRSEGEQLEAYVCCAGVLFQAVYHDVHCGGLFCYVGEPGGDHLSSGSFVSFDVFVYSLTFLDLTLLGQLLEINVVAGICCVEVNCELLQDFVRGVLLVAHWQEIEDVCGDSRDHVCVGLDHCRVWAGCLRSDQWRRVCMRRIGAR